MPPHRDPRASVDLGPDHLGSDDLIENHDAVGIPRAPFDAGCRSRTDSCGVRMLLRIEHHNAESLCATGKSKPLTADKSGLPSGPRRDLLAKMPVDFITSGGVERHSDQHCVHI